MAHIAGGVGGECPAKQRAGKVLMGPRIGFWTPGFILWTCVHAHKVGVSYCRRQVCIVIFYANREEQVLHSI